MSMNTNRGMDMDLDVDVVDRKRIYATTETEVEGSGNLSAKKTKIDRPDTDKSSHLDAEFAKFVKEREVFIPPSGELFAIHAGSGFCSDRPNPPHSYNEDCVSYELNRERFINVNNVYGMRSTS